MRKLVSISAVLLFLVGLFAVNEPAEALPPCSCSYCANRPTNLCVNFEDGGFWFRCSDYTELFCLGLNSPAETKVASEPAKLGSESEFFPLELLGVPAPENRLYPTLLVVKPGC